MEITNENRVGGILLMIGVVVFLITVYFEFQVGWISRNGGPEEVPIFLRENWTSMKSIWLWQMIGGIISLLAYLLLFKNSAGIKSVLWGLLFIGGIMSSIAFMLTLGSYASALDVYDSQPQLFNAIRGGIRYLYKNISIGPFLLIAIYCLETFQSGGAIKRNYGIMCLIVVFSLIVIGVIIGISVKLSGLPLFLIPFILGYFYWKKN